MSSLPQINSSNSLNKKDSKGNLFKLNKSNSKESLLESVLESTNNFDNDTNDVMFFSKQKIFEEKDWRPPSRTGLTNSEPILPSYYLQKIADVVDENGEPIKYMNVEYVNVIKDDIRNMRKLNEYQIKYIKIHLDEKTKNEIIDEFIKIINSSTYILNL